MFCLICIELTCWQLDAHHVNAFLALTVDSLLQAHRLKAVMVDTLLQECL